MNDFAEACYEMNTIDELAAALSSDADETDMATWSITAQEWRDQIAEAITELESDA